MARYSTTVRSPWSAEKAFDYVTDLRNLAAWDPGVSASEIIEGTEPGVDTVYAVKAGVVILRYETKVFTRPTRSTVLATTRSLRSYDVLSVTEHADGCEVEYDATLELKGVASIFNPILGPIFNRIGDRAAAGLAKALDGAEVSV